MISITALNKLSLANKVKGSPHDITSRGKVVASASFQYKEQSAPQPQPSTSQKLFKAPQQADKYPQYTRLQQPTAVWLGEWIKDPTQTVKTICEAAKTKNQIPQFVIYMIPGRDMGGYSAGGSKSPDEYKAWVDKVHAGLTTESIITLEPDALVHDVSNERVALLQYAVNKLSQHKIYLDAGHPRWHSAEEVAKRLKAANVHLAAGFALNVSNFVTTEICMQYGKDVSARISGAHFVIDVSRNGSKDMPGTGDWANPDKARLGQNPTLDTGESLCDGLLWIKSPGESDGWGGIDPSPAGEFRTKLADSLLK